MTENVNKLPVGRPPNARSVRVLAGRASHAAMRVLVDVANSEQAADKDRVRAAEVILQHATAKPATSSATGDTDA